MQLHPLLSFDGTTPAPGVLGLNVARPVQPAVQGDPQRREPLTYAAVINQFAVGVNPRYVPRDTSGDGVRDTHCDRFASDVCDAMGVVLPQWQGPDGNPTEPGHGRELGANDLDRWLRFHGARFGWREVVRSEVQSLANLGHPCLVTWCNPTGGSGHIAVVRPGDVGAEGPVIAQAGARLFNRGTLAQGFGAHSSEVTFWTNDKGGTVNAAGQWTPPAELVLQAEADLQSATPVELALATALFQRLIERQGARSAVSGVKLPSFEGCPPLVRADWLDVARSVRGMSRATDWPTAYALQHQLVTQGEADAMPRAEIEALVRQHLATHPPAALDATHQG